MRFCTSATGRTGFHKQTATGVLAADANSTALGNSRTAGLLKGSANFRRSCPPTRNHFSTAAPLSYCNTAG